MNTEQIQVVLKNLDVDNDKLWTDNGLPRISVFKESVTRAEITAAAPEFYRENLVLPESVLPESVLPESVLPESVLPENIKTDKIEAEVKVEVKVERNDVDNIPTLKIDTKQNTDHELNILDVDILKAQQNINQQQHLLNDLKNEKNKLQEKMLLDHPTLIPGALIQEHIKSEYKNRLKNANANAEILNEIRNKVPGAMRSALDKALSQKTSQRIIRPVFPVLKNATP